MVKRKTSLSKKTHETAQKRQKRQRHTNTCQELPQWPLAYYYVEDNIKEEINIGPMNKFCVSCHAARFNCEPPGICCGNGKIQLPPHPEPPTYLSSLLSDNEHFLSNIRKYNSIFQMTSFACTARQLPGWNPTFTVQGQIFHNIGSMFPATDNVHKFLQIYFIDNRIQELNTRMAITNDLRANIVEGLSDMLQEHNSYVRSFKTAAEILQKEQDPNLAIVIHEERRPRNEHSRRFNVPIAEEVAILMPNEPTAHRDIVIRQREGPLKHISELHRSYDPLQYPLLFPHGTDGYNIYMSSAQGKKVTQMQYYSYHIMCRQTNHLLQCRRLFQQFIVDVYCKIETERLLFLRREQKTLRAESYSNLQDSLINVDSDPANLGQRIVLPATFTGGPRYMHQKQQDAITYVRAYGRPDLFITTTTNPKWAEITENLLPHQTAADRPDIVARVFHQKLKKLMQLLKGGCFGDVQAWLFSVEFQKRGLPHAHILIWLAPQAKINPENIDHVISAEIPCPTETPILHELVKANMIHGPCGPFNWNSPCMKDGKCTKSFPKDFIDTTQTGHDGYPKYRRRKEEDGGKTLTLKKHPNGTCGVTVSNQWVVPYNPFLLRQMKSHTNVELCMSVKSIKYVLKYVNKGCDQAIYSLQQSQNRSSIDEIGQYQHARYVGSTEAAYRVLGCPIHEHFPPVSQLAIHLENGQRVYFTETTTTQELSNRQPPRTTLTEFFVLCQRDPFAKTLTYPQVPQYYTWNKKWERRKRGIPDTTYPGIFKSQCLGRVYTISPNQGECYFLRLLLHEVKGPESFQHLREVNGHDCSSYREACLKLGLIADDNHLHQALSEAAESSHPAQLRQLFAIILTSCEPTDPKKLWENHQNSLAEDLFFLHQTELNEEQSREVYNSCLLLIEELVQQMGGQEISTYGLKVVHTTREHNSIEYNRHTRFPLNEQLQHVAENEPKCTDEQQHVYRLFCTRVETAQPGLLFLDAPGGTGKTFLLNLILAKIRSQQKVVIATASSGIAATLLTGGRTLHATFKIPLDVHMKDMPTCNIKKGTALAKVINECSAIIVDEAPMTHKAAYEAIDRTLQDIRGKQLPFGGIPTLLCGDFRQILPVVKNGTEANIIDACLKKSYLWNSVTTVHLHTNLRALLTEDPKAASYSKFLLSVGDFSYPVTESPNIISLQDALNSSVSTENLIKTIFEDLPQKQHDDKWTLERAILAPLNETVDNINHQILTSLPSAEIVYKSFDTTTTCEEAVHFPVEFLNSLNVSGLPPHRLTLKIGCPVIVLRSIDPPALTNGTRCKVHACHSNVIEVIILHGPAKGKHAFIPRIPLVPSTGDLPFQFKRLQFPLRLCYAMTINKAQGQTFGSIGVDLSTPVFSHGMLYVALSRVGTPAGLHVFTPDNKTKNIVFKEIL